MKKKTNLYKEYQNHLHKKKSIKLGGNYLLILGVASLIVVALGARNEITKRTLQDENRQLTAFVENPAALEAYEKVERLRSELDSMNQLKESVENVESVLALKQSMEAQVFIEIQSARPATLSITTVSIVDSAITVGFSATNSIAVATFADNLATRTIFSDVSYNGYSIDGNGRVTGQMLLTLGGIR